VLRDALRTETVCHRINTNQQIKSRRFGLIEQEVLSAERTHVQSLAFEHEPIQVVHETVAACKQINKSNNKTDIKKLKHKTITRPYYPLLFIKNHTDAANRARIEGRRNLHRLFQSAESASERSSIKRNITLALHRHLFVRRP